MAIDAVTIRFATSGVQEVQSAFARVSTQLRKFEEQATRESERGARSRSGVTRNEEREKERAYRKLQQDVERLERQKTKDTESEAKRREAIARRSSEQAGRYAAQQAREEIREAERVSRAVEREEERKMRIRIRSSELAGRAAAREAQEEIRARESVSRRRGQVVSRSVAGIAGTAATIGGATLGLGGGMFIADAGRRQLSAERAAALLANSATIGGVAPAGANVQNILAQASATASATGVNKEDLIGSVQNYVAKSSDFAGGMANMGFFARLSQASGSRLEDITGAAGILRAQNKNLSTSDMRQMLLDMTEQGKQGAVEISDMAHLAGGLGSTRGLYQGSATENQRKLLALSQIARTESESPEEAATAVKDMGIQAVKKATGKDAPAWLRNAVDAKTGLIKGGPEALIEAALKGTGGNLGELEKTFDARGVKPFMRLAPIFNEAGGGDRGLAAVRAEMGPIMNAKGSEADMNKQFDAVMSTPGARFALAVTKLQELLMQKLEPAFVHLAEDTLPKLMPVFEDVIRAGDKFATWFADNPLKGIGAVIEIAVAKEIATASIGKGIEKAFSNSLGQASIAVGSMAVAAQLVKLAVEADVEHQGRKQGESVVATTSAVADIGSTPKTPEGLRQLKEIRDKVKGEVDRSRSEVGKTGALESVFQGVAQVGQFVAGGTFADDMVQKKVQEQARLYDQNAAALLKLNKAIDALEKNLSNPPHPVKSTAPHNTITDRPVS